MAITAIRRVLPAAAEGSRAAGWWGAGFECCVTKLRQSNAPIAGRSRASLAVVCSPRGLGAARLPPPRSGLSFADIAPGCHLVFLIVYPSLARKPYTLLQAAGTVSPAPQRCECSPFTFPGPLSLGVLGQNRLPSDREAAVTCWSRPWVWCRSVWLWAPGRAVSVVVGLWLLQLCRVWYKLPLLFPGFSALLFIFSSLGNPSHRLAGREQSLWWCGSTWPQPCAPQLVDPPARDWMGADGGGFSSNQNWIQTNSLTFLSSPIRNWTKRLFSSPNSPKAWHGTGVSFTFAGPGSPQPCAPPKLPPPPLLPDLGWVSAVLCPRHPLPATPPCPLACL